MTREEQIEKAEIKYFDETCFDGCDYIGEAAKTAAFIAGAEWADEHPKEGLASLDKVCEWLENKCENKREYISGLFGGPCSINIMFENISKDLRKAMEE